MIILGGRVVAFGGWGLFVCHGHASSRCFRDSRFPGEKLKYETYFHGKIKPIPISGRFLHGVGPARWTLRSSIERRRHPPSGRGRQGCSAPAGCGCGCRFRKIIRAGGAFCRGGRGQGTSRGVESAQMEKPGRRRSEPPGRAERAGSDWPTAPSRRSRRAGWRRPVRADRLQRPGAAHSAVRAARRSSSWRLAGRRRRGPPARRGERRRLGCAATRALMA